MNLPEVDFVTVGTVGPPGERVFYLQARSGDERVSLKLEKTQVAALAAALAKVLEDLPPPDASTIPDEAQMELEEPVEPDWVAGEMGLSTFDESSGHAVLVLKQLVRGEDEEDDAEVARLGLAPAQMVALVRRGATLVAAGRPPCPACGLPLDDEHSCPKTNGHLKR